ncbi:MAG: hypothetical protein V4494_00910, partial [Chlamydiota bacterium]
PVGSAKISTSNNNSPIMISAGGSGDVRLAGGIRPESYAQVVARESDVTIEASGSILANASNSIGGFGTNGNASIQSGLDLVLQANNGDIIFTGGNAFGAYAAATATQTGNMTVQALNGAVQCLGGSSTSGNSSVTLITQRGGNIEISSDSLNFSAGTGVNAQVTVFAAAYQGVGHIEATISNDVVISGASIATGIGGGEITFNAMGDITFQNALVSTKSVNGNQQIVLSSGPVNNITFTDVTMSTLLGNIEMIAGDSISYINSKFHATVPAMGAFSAIAGNDLAFDALSSVTVKGQVQPAALFVVDNNNPMSVGSGQFVYPIGAHITAPASGFVRIYTAARMINNVQVMANINGLNYVPSFPAGMNTNQEVWNTAYPTVPAFPENGSDHFTIYYKSINN